MAEIIYRKDAPLTADQFIDLLSRTSLGERRPLDDYECMKGMVENASLTITAWQGDTLVGVARSVTDFYFACYVSDLAVDEAVQSSGIGKTLLSETQKYLGKHCMITLIAAPKAMAYYPKIGFAKNDRCWTKI